MQEDTESLKGRRHSDVQYLHLGITPAEAGGWLSKSDEGSCWPGEGSTKVIKIDDDCALARIEATGGSSAGVDVSLLRFHMFPFKSRGYTALATRPRLDWVCGRAQWQAAVSPGNAS